MAHRAVPRSKSRVLASLLCMNLRLLNIFPWFTTVGGVFEGNWVVELSQFQLKQTS